MIKYRKERLSKEKIHKIVFGLKKEEVTEG
jgi:hypothetical protein